MVTRDDLEFQNLPPECCSNCGFLMQFKADHDGNNGRDEEVTYYERWAGLDYLNEQVWQEGNRKLASLRCWMRRDFPSGEAGPAITGQAEAKRLITEAMHRDRSEGSNAYCPQFTPWVRHLDFRQHWEERKLYLLERDRRRLQEKIHNDTQTTQRILAGLAALTIGVTVLVGWCNADATRDAARIQGEQPITIVVRPQSSPDTSAGQP